MSWLSKGVDSVGGVVNKLSGALFGGSKQLQSYNAPNLDFLKKPAGQVDYSFLLNAANQSGNLASHGVTAYDFLKPTADTSTGAWQDWIKTIGAPSSVDEVWSQINNEKLQSTLGDIERDTRGKYGTEIMSSFGRGIFDPSKGADSDIARVGMAQVAASGARTSADARLKAYEDELARLTGKEQAVQGAYGQRYTTSTGADLTREQLAAGLAGDAASGYNALLGTGAGLSADLLKAYGGGMESNVAMEEERKKALANALLGVASGQSAASTKTQNPGLLNTMLNNWASSAGQQAGSGGGASKYITGFL